MFQELGRHYTGCRLPEATERLIEQIGLMNLQVQRFQKAERGFVPVREVPRVLDPYVASAGKDALVLFVFLGNFLPPDLVHGLRKLPNDVDLSNTLVVCGPLDFIT